MLNSRGTFKSIATFSYSLGLSRRSGILYVFALYFSSEDGSRKFIAAVDEQDHANAMAKLLSKTDPRQVLVIENSDLGNTTIGSVFWHGSAIAAAAMMAKAEGTALSEIPGASFHESHRGEP